MNQKLKYLTIFFGAIFAWPVIIGITLGCTNSDFMTGFLIGFTIELISACVLTFVIFMVSLLKKF